MDQNKNILVTAIGSLTSVEVIKVLRDNSFRVIGIDCDVRASNKEKCDSFFVSPNAKDQKEYIDFILRLCKIENVNTIIPVSTSEVEALSSNKTLLKKDASNNLHHLLI